MATMIGGILGVFLFSMLWEWVIFKRVMNDPLAGKTLSVFAGYLTCVVVWGFSSTTDGSWNPSGFYVYSLGLAIVGFFFIKKGMRLREDALYAESDSADDLEQTFR